MEPCSTQLLSFSYRKQATRRPPADRPEWSRRSSPRIANIKREKAIPAMAAAFGVFSCAWVRVPFSGIAIVPCFCNAGDLKLESNSQDAFSALFRGGRPAPEHPLHGPAPTLPDTGSFSRFRDRARPVAQAALHDGAPATSGSGFRSSPAAASRLADCSNRSSGSR